jgi:hypothetical protein
VQEDKAENSEIKRQKTPKNVFIKNNGHESNSVLVLGSKPEGINQKTNLPTFAANFA